MKSALVTSILTLLASASLVLAQSTATAKPTIAPPAAAQSLVDRNRAVALRVFEEIFNRRRPEVAAEIYASDFRNHGIHSVPHSRLTRVGRAVRSGPSPTSA